MVLSTKLVIAMHRSQADTETVNTLHLLHNYAITLAKFDKTWSVRDLARFLSAYLDVSGVKLHAETINDSLTQDAFARGETVDTPVVPMQNGVSADKVQEALLAILDVRADPSRIENTGAKGAAELDNQGAARALTTGTAELPPPKVGTSSLPPWRTEPAQSGLRDPPPNESLATSKPAYGSSSSPARKTTAKQSKAGVKTASRAPMEKVVLVPVERNEEDQAPKSRDLNTFLEESDEDHRYDAQTAQSANASSEAESSESEESASEDDDDDGSSDEEVIGNHASSSAALLGRPSAAQSADKARPG